VVPLVWPLLALAPLLAACLNAQFIPTDDRAVGRRRSDPAVFVDRRPPWPYESIGIIEVSGPPAHMDLSSVMRAAQEAGAKAGCDLVLDRALHVATGPGADADRWAARAAAAAPVSGAPRGRLLVQYQPYPGAAPYQQAGGTSTSSYTPPPVYAAPSPPPERRQFICGVIVERARSQPPEPPPGP
jgi:hypothetical protein